MRTRLLAVAKRRLGSIGAARGVCSHPGRAARHESPEGELRRLAGYDQTLARRGSFLRPPPTKLYLYFYEQWDQGYAK